MKLTLRTDIISEISKILCNKTSTNLLILLGTMNRDFFHHSLCKYDFNSLKGEISNKYIKTKISYHSFELIYDIGFVNNYFLRLCRKQKNIKENQKIGSELESYKINDSYDIIFSCKNEDYSIFIKFNEKPKDIKEFFDSVKYIYEIIDKTPLKICNNFKEVMTNFNRLFNKNLLSYPYIVSQGLNFIDKNTVKDIVEHVVMPMGKGNKIILYLSSNGAYLISKKNILKIQETKVSEKLYDTVIMGYWYKKTFVGYDILFMSGVDVRKKSLLKRMVFLSIICKYFSFCNMVEYYFENIAERTEKLLETNDGVIFSPIKANFSNNRVYLYQPIEKVGIVFKLELYTKFNTYNIYINNNNRLELFTGSEKFPYKNSIPLCKEDRQFIGPVKNSFFEFRWECDSFIPYKQVSEEENIQEIPVVQVWDYINNPVLKKDFIGILKLKSKGI
jgi:hypothetical protein